MVLRAVLVVALVAAAALSLSARDGLDWAQLADPLEVRWARLVLGSVAIALLAALARGVLRRLRRARPHPASGDRRAEPDGEPFPLLLRVLAVVLVLATLAAAWWVIGAVAPDVPETPVATPPADGPESGPSAVPPGPDWSTLLLVGSALVAVALVSRLRALREDPATDTIEDDSGEEGEDTAAAGELSSAIAAGQAELFGQQDPRAAILAAYAAMSARIESGLVAAGRAASAADTPTELLSRAAAARLVDGTAAATLTALFREARFSRHPMGQAHRLAAEQALATVHHELTARRG